MPKGKSTRSARHRVFWAITLFVLVSDALFFGLNVHLSGKALDDRFDAWAEERQTTATLMVDQTIGAMLLMAEMLAQDKEIHRLARSGRAAVMAEGGGPGGQLAAEHRRQLLERLGPAWRVATERYGVRQLHFHIGPGDLSFLRVHKPDRFGDRMDELRPLVVDSIAQGRPIGGFELGRIYSGLRGIVPIFDQPGVTEGTAIGAVEVGTSFDPVLARISEAAGGHFAILLNESRVDMAVFRDQRATAVMDMTNCRCVLEATTDLRIVPLVDALSADFFADPVMGERRLGRIETTAETGETRTFEIAAWPLMDHKGATQGGKPPGWVVTWLDATPIMADYRDGIIMAGVFAILAFLGLEVVLFFAVRYAFRALEQRIDTATADLARSNEALSDANTDLAAANTALEQASAAKSQFLATMSHEIRTPMNGVLGMADLLADEALTEKQSRMLSTIRSSGELLMHTISDILDVSKLGAGKITLETIDFSLCDVAREVVDIQNGAAAKKGLRLDLAVQGDGTCRRGDPHRIAQILHNLLSNAIKFSDRGTVAITVGARGADAIKLTVADNGVGMTEEQASRIFDAYAQADASTTRRSGGTGLGLSIVRGLVERMGGRIDLETAPGEGACFTVTLPLPAAAPAAHDDRPAQQLGELTALRVLAVDDNEINRMVLDAMLDHLGVETVMVSSGADALTAFADEGPFDAILLDVVMPQMDGPETRRRLAAIAEERGQRLPPVIACTAQSLPDEIRALLEDGFTAHLAKPIDRDAIAATLRNATVTASARNQAVSA